VYPKSVDETTVQVAPGGAGSSGIAGWLRAIPYALLGLVVAFFCVLIPGLHFFLGPFGPLIGGMVAGNRCGGGVSSVIVISSVMSIALALPTAALTGMLFPEQATTGLAKAAPFIVFFYTGIMSFIGGMIGMVMGSQSESAD
jgi:hypothetical protein